MASTWRRWKPRWRAWVPAPLPISRREVWLGAAGVGLGLVLTEWLSHQALDGINPWFIAPMSASAVLAFSVQASPLAQPWPVLGGNLLSALIGVGCQRWLGHGGMVAALAAALAVALMFTLRCPHPPGGAVAVTAVLGGSDIERLGFSFALWPVATNSVIILALALLYHRVLGRRYPHQVAAGPHHASDPLPGPHNDLTEADLDAALSSFHELLDIDRDDLAEILARAQSHALQRQGRSMPD